MSETNDNPGVIAQPPLIFALMLATGLIINWLWPAGFAPWPLKTRFLISLPAFIPSGLIALAARYEMKKHATAINPSEPTTAIVSSGVFGLTRNPMYLALVLLMASISLIANSLWSLALLVPFALTINYGVIVREEVYLKGKFGEPYIQYMGRVRRWI